MAAVANAPDAAGGGTTVVISASRSSLSFCWFRGTRTGSNWTKSSRKEPTLQEEDEWHPVHNSWHPHDFLVEWPVKIRNIHGYKSKVQNNE